MFVSKQLEAPADNYAKPMRIGLNRARKLSGNTDLDR